MKVVVDFDKCKSHAICMRTAPKVFEVRDDGFLYILQEEPEADQHDGVRRAVKGCPTGAIRADE